MCRGGEVLLQHSDVREEVGIGESNRLGRTAAHTGLAFDADPLGMRPALVQRDAARRTALSTAPAALAAVGSELRQRLEELSRRSILLFWHIIGRLEPFARHGGGIVRQQRDTVAEGLYFGSVGLVGTVLLQCRREDVPCHHSGSSHR